MSFDYKRLTSGEVIAAFGAVALFIVMFLPWYSLKGGNRTLFLLRAGGSPSPPTGNAWEAYSTIYLLLLALVVVGLAMAALAAAPRELEFSFATGVTVYGLLMVGVIIYKVFVHRPGGNKFSEVDYGAYLGLAAIIAITVGAFLTARRDQASRRARGEPRSSGRGDTDASSESPPPAPEESPPHDA
jgi:hypothetical protein